MAAAFAERAGVAAAARLAALLVGRELVEAAVLGVLVDLGAADLLAAGDHEDRRFLAALELSQDRIDPAVVDERLQALGGFHPACATVITGSSSFPPWLPSFA